MVWLPPVRAEVVMLARCTPPTVLSAAVPSVWLVVVSVKMTLPVGRPPALVTTAVKVTGWVNWLGLFGSIVVVVAICACAAPNDSITVAHASAAAPIMRRSFSPAPDAHNVFLLSFLLSARKCSTPQPPNCFHKTTLPLESARHRVDTTRSEG
jgi:hypothetical protein